MPLQYFHLQMWSRLCPTRFGMSTCWSSGPSSWRLWRLTMLRRMRRQRSDTLYTLSVRKSKGNNHRLLLFIRMRLTLAWNGSMIQKQLWWRMGSAPPRPLRVTLRLPWHPKPLRPVSRQSQQVPSIHPSDKHSAICDSHICVFNSVVNIFLDCRFG